MSESSAPHRTTWSAEEIGFLAGGPGRAAEAVLARLLDGGLVRVSREGLVTAVHQNGYGARTPLEAYVLAGLQGTARPINQVVQVAMASHEMGALQASLVARGMVHREFGKPRGGKIALRVVLFLLAFVSVFVAFAIDTRVFVLTALLVFVAILLRKPGRLTRNGKTVWLYALRNPSSSADAVALSGLRRGKQRSTSSTSYAAAGCGSYDWNHHSCGGTSSCSSNSSSSCSSCSSSSSSSSSCSSSSSSCGGGGGGD
ncbi:TIGR04222 domain-containing protein [Lentzea albidocapillata subsp. violacea]|uniref:TIGR04222 domain-containing protein n=1 Tax=Lentzea albidocapillata subsp. violacea TaxID=128104 RepID=A0A1G9V7Y3_9PSEU|nr:TIGR04222 domain-containing membrane protein [Lentzea albidocapillata]SDM68200.1 TIGR04222 domain-containing protein [Lentzea albidocapillata subsp. violacea]